MTKYFIPFTSNCPRAIEVKGHRLVIVTTNRRELKDFGDFLGTEEIREFCLPDNENEALATLAASVQVGVVVTPPGMSISTIISSLENELPWVH